MRLTHKKNKKKAIVNKKKATVMRKLILKTAACLLLSFVSLSALADPKPPVPQSQYYGHTKSSAPIASGNPYVLGKMDTEGNSVPVSEGPLTPATLVLLTLASGFAGVKIYRNNKEK